jgi:hypothetical protein
VQDARDSTNVTYGFPYTALWLRRCIARDSSVVQEQDIVDPEVERPRHSPQCYVQIKRRLADDGF